MKFCPICGRPVEDGEVCVCQGQAAGQPVQDFDIPDEEPVRSAAAPKGESRFMKALKNIPASFRGYFKNSDRVIEIAKSKRDFVLPLLYIGILFLVNLMLGTCFFARMSSTGYFSGLGILAGVFGGIYFRFNFGLVLVSALIITAVVSMVCVGARFISLLIFAKKSPLDALFYALIEFGFHSIPVSCLLLCGTVLGLISAWLLVPMVGFAASYLLVVYITTTVKEAEGFGSKLTRNMILTAVVTVSVALVFWMLHLMCAMNYGV